MNQPLIMQSLLPNGDCAVIIDFMPGDDRLLGIHGLCVNLLRDPIPGLVNVIPAEANLTLVFEQPVTNHQALIPALASRCQQLEHWQPVVKTHDIPVCYDPQLAVDLSAVCEQVGLTTDELIARHTAPEYTVKMLGFLPGFAYLGGNDDHINLPRKATPAKSVAVGSVAVAGPQTGIYALASPGGWHVIGRTPLPLIDWANDQQPMRFSPMDRVRFQAIDLATFKTWQAPS